MSRPRSRYDTLERMLNTTTLTVQRVTHRHIIGKFQTLFTIISLNAIHSENILDFTYFQ